MNISVTSAVMRRSRRKNESLISDSQFKLLKKTKNARNPELTNVSIFGLYEANNEPQLKSDGFFF